MVAHKKASAKPASRKLLTADELSRQIGLGGRARPSSLVDSIRNSLFAPFDFFEHLARSDKMDGAVGYLLFMAALPSVYSFLSYVMLLGSPLDGLKIGLMQFAIVIFLSSLSTGIVHIILKLAGAKKGFATTFKTAVYAGTPWFIFSAVPIVSLFALIWSVYLQVVGLTKTQKAHWLPALLATLLPILLGFSAIVAFLLSNPALVAELASPAA